MSSIRHLMRGVTAAALMGLAGFANAATVGGSASAFLFLDNLQMAVIFGTGAPDEAVNGTTLVSATADDVTDSDAALGVFVTLDATATSNFGTASSLSAPGVISAAAASTLPGVASAEVARSGQVNFLGAGTLVLQIPYQLQVDMPTLPDAGSHASASIVLNAFRLNSSTAQYSSSALLLFDQESGPGSSLTDGFLSLAIPFIDGDQYLFTADVEAAVVTSVVPVPPALWLLGSAVVVLGRRRAR